MFMNLFTCLCVYLCVYMSMRVCMCVKTRIQTDPNSCVTYGIHTHTYMHVYCTHSPTLILRLRSPTCMRYIDDVKIDSPMNTKT